VSVHAVTDWASAAIDWRLFLPESWDDTKAADGESAAEIRRWRARSAIPDEMRHREKWRPALDMLDEVTGEWGLPGRPVVADAGYGDATEFRLGLTERGLTHVPAVSPTAPTHPAEAAPVTPAWKGTGRPPQPRYPDSPQDLKSLAMAAGRSAGRYVLWRHGSRKTPGNPTASMRSRFLALRVRPANRNIPRDSDGSLPECRLLAEWPPGEPEPTGYWLSTLPTEMRLRDLVRLAKIRWRIEHDYRELEDGLGLDHFEGRSWLGWHRHVTLAAVAQAICTQLRHTPKALRRPDPPTQSCANCKPCSRPGQAPATPVDNPTRPEPHHKNPSSTAPNKALPGRRGRRWAAPAGRRASPSRRYGWLQGCDEGAGPAGDHLARPFPRA
jgi:SRSO17 transposase